ncbi:very short patch repair endonuclease [Dyadobacter jiangsuensis]
MATYNKEGIYLRDGRAPVPQNQHVSRSMSGNRAKNTKPELAIRKMLWSERIRGYRINFKKLPGRPDIVFQKNKMAIFIHGCFWHRCVKCQPNHPKSNLEFWRKKFEDNVARDKRNLLALELLGFKVITIWECEIKNDLRSITDTLRKELNNG